MGEAQRDPFQLPNCLYDFKKERTLYHVLTLTSFLMNRFLLRFVPRSRSPAIFFVGGASYILAWKAVAPTMVALLGLWPVTVGQGDGVGRPIRLGLGDPTTESLVMGAFRALIFAPIFESLLLIGLIALLRRLGFTSLTQVTASALTISLAHSLSQPILGLLVAPCFFIEASSYVYWRRTSLKLATGMIVGLHFVANIIPVLREIARRNL